MTERKLTKRELSVLERVYEHEIDSALRCTVDLLPMKSKLAASLAKRGFLEHGRAEFIDRYGTYYFAGYRLTHAGRIAYCESCKGKE